MLTLHLPGGSNLDHPQSSIFFVDFRVGSFFLNDSGKILVIKDPCDGDGSA
jgi:hypothetical protein